MCSLGNNWVIQFDTLPCYYYSRSLILDVHGEYYMVPMYEEEKNPPKLEKKRQNIYLSSNVISKRVCGSYYMRKDWRYYSPFES